MKAIRYFHPSGKSMPNGSYYQRGGFLYECRQNAQSFVETESGNAGIIVTGGQNPVSGIIRQCVLGYVNQKEKVEFGNFFSGTYPCGDLLFDSTSECIRISDISFGELKTLLKRLKELYPSMTFLLKHNDSTKIYLH